jgi:hypothetical protein
MKGQTAMFGLSSLRALLQTEQHTSDNSPPFPPFLSLYLLPPPFLPLKLPAKV